MSFDANMPIYLQIIDDFKKQLISGKYQPSDKIASVRDLAVQYGVNPNTVQRALTELERMNYVKSERTSGRFISADIQMIEELKKQFIGEKVNRFIDELSELNFDKKEIMQYVEGRINHGNTD